MALRRDDMARAAAVAAPGAAAIAAVAAVWGARASAAAIAAAASLAFVGLRGAIDAGRVRRRARREAEPSPLARLVQRFSRRVHELDSEAEVAAAAEELLEVGLGYTGIVLLIPSPDDYSWRRADGTAVDERAAPDPRLLPWLLDVAGPIEKDAIHERASDDLREPASALLAAHGASFALPLVSRDEIVGLVMAEGRTGAARLNDAERRFLRQVVEQAAAALVYVGLKRQAIERVELAKDVELTAAVQEAFIPPRDPVELGAVRIAGAYIPASRCGGDWWSFRHLSRGRALVLIGDATGHGIGAAMVTAAAKGCADVVLERLGDAPDLGQVLDAMDAAIRRVGAGQFHMTLFATLLDPREGAAHFANAGHNVPYLCRPRPGRRPELKVLPARGNPLGSGDGPVYELGSRPIAPGDVLVWYTDGLVEAHGGDHRPFGDRRMQRCLRELAAAETDAVAIRDGLLRASLSFQGARRPHDDMTAVVASIAAADATGAGPVT